MLAGSQQGEPAPAGTSEPLPDPATFLSGESGHVAGLRATARAVAGDLVLDGLERALGVGRRLDRLVERTPRREVLAVSLYRPGTDDARRAVAELARSRHAVRLALGSLGRPDPQLAAHTVASELRGGKFENLNAVVAASGDPCADWVLVVDDDVALPPRFLDRLLALCERYDLAVAQPAQSLRSHAAWRVTRRRPLSVLRETRFVEIGPVTAFRRDAFAALAPFPPLRFGWGLDLHWSALAAERGWRLGVADAVVVRHERQPVGRAYPIADAMAEAQRFLAGRAYLPSARAQEVVRVYRPVGRALGPG